MFITEALAAQNTANVGSLGSTLVQIALILLIFYFLLIRPQQKRIKEHTEMVNLLKVGDKVVTSSGIYGTISQIKDNEIMLEIAPSVNIKIEAMSVSHKLQPQTAPQLTKVEKHNKTATAKSPAKAVKSKKTNKK